MWGVVVYRISPHLPFNLLCISNQKSVSVRIGQVELQ
jgi:hypothetical protein